MDRDQIERQDFPAARRGYDAGAVNEHLKRVADAFEELARRPAPGSLAEDAATRVQAIVAAAESSARALREDAAREAGEHVERVREAAAELVARIGALHAEADRLLGGLRSSAESLAGSLDELSRDVRSLHEPAETAAPEPPPANGTRSDDEAGARLVALNMALEGATRQDAAAYLAEHYELGDLDGLLDDVYASAGK